MVEMLSTNSATLWSRACWSNIVITTLRRLRQGDQKFEANLSLQMKHKEGCCCNSAVIVFAQCA